MPQTCLDHLYLDATYGLILSQRWKERKAENNNNKNKETLHGWPAHAE